MLVMNKRGKIIPNGVRLEQHELDTILFFTNLGKTIELVPPSSTPNSKTPDFKMDGLMWEMKNPQGKSKTTLEHVFKKAVKQSENIIIDLSRIKMKEEIALAEISKCFHQTRACKRLIIITKNRQKLDFKK